MVLSLIHILDDLKSILTKDNCKSGMLEYLKLYDGGKLPAVAEKINDGGQYINQLQYKFSSDAANWVWNTDTVNAKIDELICEYEIIEISNGVLSKNATYMEAIRAWVDKIGQIRLAYSMIKNEPVSYTHLQKPDFTGMAFTGVRGDESLSRSEYDAISYGGKHSGQYSCHPILEWNTAELFLYIYENGLTFNNAYKKGNTRARCV